MKNTTSVEESTTVENTTNFNSSEKQEIIPVGMAAIVPDVETGKFNLVVSNMKLNKEMYDSIEEAQNAYYNDMWIQDMKLASIVSLLMDQVTELKNELKTLKENKK